MQRSLAQFNPQANALKPVYLIHGDEPFLRQQAVEQVRQAAAQAGYDGAERYLIDDQFDWGQLAMNTASLSLFASQRLIELNFNTLPPDNSGKQALADLLSGLDRDTLLLLHGPRLGKDKQRAAWFKQLDQLGEVVAVYPLTAREMPAWLRQRAAFHQVNLEADALQLLASHLEGNLLAADQELQKLALMHPGQHTSAEQLGQWLTQQSRHSTFELIDTLLGDDAVKALAVLDDLRAQGVEPVIISWAIAREVQTLLELGPNPDPASMQRKGIWRQRQTLVKQALQRLTPQLLHTLLQRCAELDWLLKQCPDEDPWQWLAHTSLLFTAQWHTQQHAFKAPLNLD